MEWLDDYETVPKRMFLGQFKYYLLNQEKKPNFCCYWKNVTNTLSIEL